MPVTLKKILFVSGLFAMSFVVIPGHEAQARNDALRGAVIGGGVGALIGGSQGAAVGVVGGAIIGANN